MRQSSHKLPFHYGWIIVPVGTLTVFACLGLGRFALGMLLPSMVEDLALNYTQVGVIGTGNFVGYLSAVLTCGWLVQRLGARTVIFLGLLLVGGTMMLVSRMDHYLAILVFYFLTGVGSGAANVPLMGLVAHWFSPQRRGRAAGFIVVGSGFAIMLSGTLIPLLNADLGVAGWRDGWMLLGALVTLISLVCGWLLRNDPEGMGLKPMGAEVSTCLDKPSFHSAAPPRSSRHLIAHIGAIYFLFGFTYVIYATFIVTTLVQEMGYSEAAAGKLWVWVGFFSLFSGPVFGSLSDRIGRRGGMMIVFVLQTLAYLLAGSQLSGGWIYLSIALFGFVAWSIPSIVTAAVSDYLPREKVTTALGQITFFFGIGQIFGPSLAGVLAEASGSFSSSYLLAAGMTAAACALTLLLPDHRKARIPEFAIKDEA